MLELVVARLLVRALTAPRVGVEGEEVNRFGCVGAAGEVVLQHGAEARDVGGRVADGDFTVRLRVAVGLEVAGCGFDVWGSYGAVGWEDVSLSGSCNWPMPVSVHILQTYQ